MKTRQMGATPPSATLSRKGIARCSGVSKGAFLVRGEISIIGVVRTPVAIINLASNPCENL